MKKRNIALILLVAGLFVLLAWTRATNASPLKTVVLRVSLPPSGG